MVKKMKLSHLSWTNLTTEYAYSTKMQLQILKLKDFCWFLLKKTKISKRKWLKKLSLLKKQKKHIFAELSSK